MDKSIVREVSNRKKKFSTQVIPVKPKTSLTVNIPLISNPKEIKNKRYVRTWSSRETNYLTKLINCPLTMFVIFPVGVISC